MRASKQALILIIDDDLLIRSMISRTLALAGYQVITAEHGEAGYQQALSDSPDLIISDVMLPDINGYTLCRRLREHSDTRHIPVLMVTSKSAIEDKIQGFEAGVDDYVTKPFSPEEIRHRVAALLRRAEANELPQPIKQQRGRVLAVFSAKGGVGKTTLAVNLAVALQQRNRKVVLVDADLRFGSVSVYLNLVPQHTIVDTLKYLDAGEFDMEVAKQILLPHASGVRVLSSPPSPVEADLVTPAHLTTLLEKLSTSFDDVVVDCPSSYDECALAVLEQATKILVVLTPEVGAVKNTSRFLDVLLQIGHPLEKVLLILNRANSNVGVEKDGIERVLQQPIRCRLDSGGRPVVLSVNYGVALVMKQPEHPFSQETFRFADYLVNQEQSAMSSTIKG